MRRRISSERMEAIRRYVTGTSTPPCRVSTLTESPRSCLTTALTRSRCSCRTGVNFLRCRSPRRSRSRLKTATARRGKRTRGRYRSASLVLYRLRPDRVQPLLSLFTRSHACVEKSGIADHGCEVFKHLRRGWFRGGNRHALRRCAITESALAIDVLGGPIARIEHEIIKTELTAGARQPQVHIRST